MESQEILFLANEGDKDLGGGIPKSNNNNNNVKLRNDFKSNRKWENRKQTKTKLMIWTPEDRVSGDADDDDDDDVVGGDNNTKC